MALHLVRHADAGPPGGPDDELRPLTARGRRQAGSIAELLGAAPVGRILSSRYVRCRETVAPLADHLGVAVETTPALAEEAEVDTAWALVDSLARIGGEAVLCSHGNVLSAVLDRVHRRGVEVDAGEWACRKGSVWRLETDSDGAVVRAVLALNPR